MQSPALSCGPSNLVAAAGAADTAATTTTTTTTIAIHRTKRRLAINEFTLYNFGAVGRGWPFI